MLIKRVISDIKTIFYYTGRLTSSFSFIFLIPFMIALVMGEYAESVNFIIGFSLCIICGYIFIFLGKKQEITWIVGMIVVSFSWFVLMFVVAIPLYLSGHFSSYLDACFDAMSGLATVGLSIINDLDHLSYSMNMWRLLIPYVAGQGIIVVALVFLAATPGGYGMYLAEGREDRILPNIADTAKVIWIIAIVYFIIGVLLLFLIGLKEDFGIKMAFFHSIWLYMSAWATCGFSPQSSSMLFYYSPLIDLVTMVIFILGSISFYLHYTVWTGKRFEIFRDIEIKTFIFTLFLSFSIVSFSLKNDYNGFLPFFWNCLYHTASAHATCGLGTTSIANLGEVSLIGLIIAMAIGASGGSTGGGIKIIRIGIITKALIQDIKALAFPTSAILQERFHHIRNIVLNDRLVRSCTIIILSYLSIYLIGALVGVFCGFTFLQSLFESVAAASGTGFSCGVTSSDMPNLMKVVYIFEMWAGRLEFISIFAIIGLFIGRR
ncbi:TPA: hypothetical protein DCX16_04485 [bacterium]|nr:hypothetical protein [bacterium]